MKERGAISGRIVQKRASDRIRVGNMFDFFVPAKPRRTAETACGALSRRSCAAAMSEGRCSDLFMGGSNVVL